MNCFRLVNKDLIVSTRLLGGDRQRKWEENSFVTSLFQKKEAKQ